MQPIVVEHTPEVLCVRQERVCSARTRSAGPDGPAAKRGRATVWLWRSRAVLLMCLVVCRAAEAQAQEERPRIGPFVVDLHITVPKFGDDVQLAASRGLTQAELPGPGFGLGGGVHVYLFKIKSVTVGLGGQSTIGRSGATPDVVVGTPSTLHAVTEEFKSISPQLSLNFGNGHGWSYLSGGIGRSIWSIVPDGGSPRPADEERLSTINYGGGARWFIKTHLAFSLDVRLYEIQGGTPQQGLPGSPRSLLLTIGAGISLK